MRQEAGWRHTAVKCTGPAWGWLGVRGAVHQRRQTTTRAAQKAAPGLLRPLAKVEGAPDPEQREHACTRCTAHGAQRTGASVAATIWQPTGGSGATGSPLPRTAAAGRVTKPAWPPPPPPPPPQPLHARQRQRVHGALTQEVRHDHARRLRGHLQRETPTQHAHNNMQAGKRVSGRGHALALLRARAPPSAVMARAGLAATRRQAPR